LWRKSEVFTGFDNGGVDVESGVLGLSEEIGESWWRLKPWIGKTCYVNIFCFVFGKMNVLECSLSRKRDLAYMVNFINGKVESVLWFKSWYVNLFGFVFGKMKVLEWPLSQKNEIFSYMLLSLRNNMVEFVPRCPLKRSMVFVPIWF